MRSLIDTHTHTHTRAYIHMGLWVCSRSAKTRLYNPQRDGKLTQHCAYTCTHLSRSAVSASSRPHAHSAPSVCTQHTDTHTEGAQMNVSPIDSTPRKHKKPSLQVAKSKF
mmetsp:Transcript_23394/g.67152  ORF Transcript_23394/g.67152 Transcript_23394/m.67152 type:complete len:110 (-) Transcript_23394:562-891(-)